jgi:thioredoxin-related protein
MTFPRTLRLKIPALLLALAASAVEASAVGVWHRDYASALNEAVQGDKKLLIVFTATDWIELCAKFHDEILGEPAFIDGVSEKFALLRLEFPKDNRLPREEAAQRAFLREAYRVRGYPTVVLTDVAGRPFGLNGYQELSPEDYAGQILAIDAVHEETLASLREAESLEGAERAEKLRLGIPELPGTLMVRFYRAEMEALLAADPENRLELAESFRRLFAEADFSREAQTLAREGKWAEAAALTDRHIAEQALKGLPLQVVLLGRASVERRGGDGEKAAATLRQVVEIDPDSDPGVEAARILEALASGAEPPDSSTRP